MNKVKVGVIGAGRIGQLHAQNIIQSDLLELKAIADVYIDHLRETKFWNDSYLITNKPEEIFLDEKIDAVLICSSTDTHVDYIIKAAKKGKHIFCEKPISFNPEKTKKVLQVVKQSGVKFQVGFNRRFDKHFRKIHNLVREGKIGSTHIVKISSRDPKIPTENYIRHSGGMFMDMTIHDFDMMRYLVNSNVVDVTVAAANLVDPIFNKYDDVDTAIITLTFENGTLGVIDNSRQAVYGYDQRVEVFGEKGKIEAQNEKETNVTLTTVGNVCEDPPKNFFVERYDYSYKAEITEFARSITEGREIICTGYDGYMAELIALAAKKSWKEKRTVKMEEILQY